MKTMDDIRKIEEFLKLIASAGFNGYDISVDTIYRNLIFFDVKEKRSDISSFFEYWINHFKNNKNINVFVAEYNKNFCHFVNNNNYDVNAYNAIKLYIAIDKEHIHKGAQELFDFLAAENIQHISKVAKKIRFDDIVVRVSNPSDANKIINFVNNNKYLCEGCISTNPFAVRSGNVSVAWDGQLSYNTVVCSWINQYITWEKENGNLELVSYSRFAAFIEKKNEELFVQGIGLNDLVDYLNQNNINSYDDD